MDETESAKFINLDKWYNVHDLFSIPLGETFVLHNLSNKLMQVSISDTQPSLTDIKWLKLHTFEPFVPNTYDTELWVYGEGYINISKEESAGVLGAVEANRGTGWVDPQTDCLTNTELRSEDIKVTLDGERVEVSQSGIWDVSVNNFPTNYAKEGKQLADNHNVTVSNLPATQDVEVTNEVEVTLNGESVTVDKGTGWESSLTDDELRASDVKVTLDSEVVEVSQSGTWDISVNNFPVDYATSAKQLPDNHNVTVSNFPSEQEITLNGEVVEVSQSGTWTVAVSNLPTDYSTSAKQLPDNHNVTVSNFPAEQEVTLNGEEIAVSQASTWDVSVNNIPSNQDVTLTNTSVTVDKGSDWTEPQLDALTDVELRATPVNSLVVNSLVPSEFDGMVLTYNGNDDISAIIYKKSGATVATVTLSYTGAQLTGVTRT